MRLIVYPCTCSKEKEYDIFYNLERVMDEIVEFVTAPSLNELSDVAMTLSCLAHAIFPKWVYLLPLAGRSQDKGIKRAQENGCCRSKNWCNEEKQDA